MEVFVEVATWAFLYVAVPMVVLYLACSIAYIKGHKKGKREGYDHGRDDEALANMWRCQMKVGHGGAHAFYAVEPEKREGFHWPPLV